VNSYAIIFGDNRKGQKVTRGISLTPNIASIHLPL